MAFTTTGNLTQDVFAAIAAEMLQVVDDAHFYPAIGPVDRALEPPPPGATTVAFNSVTLDDSTFTETSRRLTEGTAINASSKAIAMTQTSLTIREYAGPYDNTAAAVVPYGITERVKKLAKHNVAAIVGSFLGRDRLKFLNTVYRDLLLTTTVVVTADGSAEGAITANQSASSAMFRRLNRKMKDQKIRPFPNGRWRASLTTQQEQELKADADYKQAMATRDDNPLKTGYVGTIENFDLFLDTYMPTKGVGAGSAVTAQQAVAWGPLGIGHEPIMDPEPRRDDNTDFQRNERVIWLSYDAIGLLYPTQIVRALST